MSRHGTTRGLVNALVAALVVILAGPVTLGYAEGKKYALLVGVSTYDPAFFHRLAFTDADATEMAGSLQKLGFDVTLMTRQSEIPARRPNTARKILDQLDRRLKGLQPDDTLLVAFSGHGVQYKQPRKLADGSQETHFFCPEEADLTQPDSLVPIHQVYAQVQACLAERKLLIVDACRNEVLSKAGKSAVDVELEPAGVTPRTVPKGMLALFSCTEGEKSFEHPDLSHGVFCYHVLKYLRGDADRKFYFRDQVSIRGLADYASRETRDFVFAKLNKDQLPELVGRTSDWSLGRLGGKSITNSIGMPLALIPAGEFDMGSSEADVAAYQRAFAGFTREQADDEKPQHRVRITKPFYLGKQEVTQAEYEPVMGTNPSWFSRAGAGKDAVSGQDTRRFPVENVSWFDAVEFCNKLSLKEALRPCYTLTNVKRDGGSIQSATATLSAGNGYRLPTEAEWEYACRAGTTTSFSTGNSEAALAEAGWYGASSTPAGNSASRTNRVGQKKANAFDLFDMHGNVFEWCEDWYDRDYYREFSGKVASDPRGSSKQASGRVFRGGGWYDAPQDARSAYRLGYSPGNRNGSLGFRVALLQANP